MFPGRSKVFLFSITSRLALGPTQATIVWGPRAVSPGIKLPELEDDHPPPASAEFKNVGSIPLLPTRLQGVVLK
jgi:hypothetical protein